LHLVTAAGNHEGQSDGGRDMEARLFFGELRRFIASLPEDQKSVLLMVCVEGLSYKEASAVLDLPLGTIASRIARARAALKDWMDGQEMSPQNGGRPDPKRETGQ
jgi:RNA polymerase sigma-70 factor (ECF subfamily)